MDIETHNCKEKGESISEKKQLLKIFNFPKFFKIFSPKTVDGVKHSTHYFDSTGERDIFSQSQLTVMKSQL